MNAGAFVIGRVRGVEIRVHWSWIVILALATVVFGSGDVPGSYPGSSPIVLWIVGLVTALLLLASALLHELAHVLVATRNGLTGGDVNVQLLGGTYILEVHPRTPGQQFRLAIAGPAVSIVTGVVLTGVATATASEEAAGLVSYPAVVLGLFNLFIGLVNLIPGYPLDGGTIVRSIVWRFSHRERGATEAASRVGRRVGYLLVILGVVLFAMYDATTGVVVGLGGWLLAAGGGSMERREMLKSLVTGLRVQDAEEREALPRVPAQLTLDTFAPEYLATPGGVVLVERGGTLAGLVGTIQARKVRRQWPNVHAADVMVALDAIPRVSPMDDLWEVLERLERSNLDGVIVRPREAAAAADGAPAAESADGEKQAAVDDGNRTATSSIATPAEPAAVTAGIDSAADAAVATAPTEAAAEPSEPEVTLLTRRSAARAIHERAQQQAGLALALRAAAQARASLWRRRPSEPVRPTESTDAALGSEPTAPATTDGHEPRDETGHGGAFRGEAASDADEPDTESSRPAEPRTPENDDRGEEQRR